MTGFRIFRHGSSRRAADGAVSTESSINLGRQTNSIVASKLTRRAARTPNDLALRAGYFDSRAAI